MLIQKGKDVSAEVAKYTMFPLHSLAQPRVDRPGKSSTHRHEQQRNSRLFVYQALLFLMKLYLLIEHRIKASAPKFIILHLYTVSHTKLHQKPQLLHHYNTPSPHPLTAPHSPFPTSSHQRWDPASPSRTKTPPANTSLPSPTPRI
jgi:hypothetical protein